MFRSYREIFKGFVFQVPRRVTVSAVVLSDIIFLVLATWIAFYLRLGVWLSPSPTETAYQPLIVALLSLCIFLPVSFTLNLYRVLFRYTGWHYHVQLAKACIILLFILSSILILMNFSGVPRTVGFIQPLVLFFLLSSSRLAAKKMFDGDIGTAPSNQKRLRVLVLGLGDSGREIASSVQADRSKELMGFAAFDTKFFGTRVFGVPVFDVSELETVLDSLEINEVLCAIPDISLQKYKSLSRRLHNSSVILRHIPGPGAFLRGEVKLGDLAIDIRGDLMFREQVRPDQSLLKADIYKKNVLVAGAGGSIGSELCRQIINLQPSSLIVIDHSEVAIFELLRNLEQLDGFMESGCEVVPFLGSVTDVDFLNVVFKKYRPHTIYNAAAYKHVDLVEKNPIEGLKNNLYGTRSLAELAIKFHSKKFVQVSTDKAVRPKSIMGASKRLCELLLKVYASKKQPVAFCSVRFGNVMDSSGSVVPIFRDQIRRGGPVTVTHRDATRFFMTIKEAAQLVIQAGAICDQVKEKTSDAPVFLLDMGGPTKILDLATRMIEFSGFKVYNDETKVGDIEIKFIGLRQGEKLHEELLITGKTLPTTHPKIMVAYEAPSQGNELIKSLDDIFTSLEARNFGRVMAGLQSVTEYDR